MLVKAFKTIKMNISKTEREDLENKVAEKVEDIIRILQMTPQELNLILEKQDVTVINWPINKIR